jgi:hypothetical protein
MVEAHAVGILRDTTIQEILGIENYSPLFEYSPRFIPSHEISLRSNVPVGSGRYGDVYRAVWHRAESRLATMRNRGKDMDIVLKDVFRHSDSKDLSRKFLEEARLLLSSVPSTPLSRSS